jgi:PEGA domain-containing protein
MRPLIKLITRTAVLAVVLVFALAASVAAAPERGGGHFHGRSGHIIVRGGFVDPFWGPYYPWGYAYPYGYGYPYYGMARTGGLKTEITPKQTEVYIDGYYAGVADNFDGAFQALRASPGGHAVTFHLDGYRTVTENIYVRLGSTSKVRETMEKLAPGEVSAPVPLPTPRTGRSDGEPAPAGSAPHR